MRRGSLASLASLAASVLTLGSILALALPTTGCPSSDEATCTDFNPAIDRNAAPKSFKENVFPLFGVHCAFSTCHGSTASNANGIYLGGFDASAIRKNLVDVPAPELSTMVFVKPGDPYNSYLMRKLDGSQCVLDAQCVDKDCGESMPKNEEKLAAGVRDDVRLWIAQGAPDN